MIALPEGAARWISHLLLGGWLCLVSTLLLPVAPGHSLGTLLFWGTTLPLILALLALVGTAPWRRICPLAHISQLTEPLVGIAALPGWCLPSPGWGAIICSCSGAFSFAG